VFARDGRLEFRARGRFKRRHPVVFRARIGRREAIKLRGVYRHHRRSADRSLRRAPRNRRVLRSRRRSATFRRRARLRRLGPRFRARSFERRIVLA
jgi:hypothetical protein